MLEKSFFFYLKAFNKLYYVEILTIAQDVEKGFCLCINVRIHFFVWDFDTFVTNYIEWNKENVIKYLKNRFLNLTCPITMITHVRRNKSWFDKLRGIPMSKNGNSPIFCSNWPIQRFKIRPTSNLINPKRI